MPKQFNTWWGPPKKFSTLFEERKISWLELFYDLVYVIVISKITHYLTFHPNGEGIMDYAYLFAITFWGWFNGSQYHDLHGSPGIRTRIMTLWQMLAVGALAVSLDSPPETLIFRTTASLIFLQLFITYLWWSVGIYDKHHRKLNVPYTICYLFALALLIATLFIPQPYKRLVFWLTIVMNYLPSFIMAFKFRKRGEEFSLSPSMTERLGLFTIIVFGEAILGVINGMGSLLITTLQVWFSFALGILIVFSLWWIFFSLVADRKSKNGLSTGSTIPLLYIPTLAALGMVGAAFRGLFSGGLMQADQNMHALEVIYGVSIAIFLCSVSAISYFLIYPAEYEGPRRLLQPLLFITGILNLLVVFLFPGISKMLYLLCVEMSLLLIIFVTTRSWFRVELKNMAVKENQNTG